MKAIGYLKHTLDISVKEFMPYWKELTDEQKAQWLDDARKDAAASGVELEDA